MKRLHIITNIILIIVAFMLQSMLFVHVSFPAVKPNLLLIVTVLSGFLNGKKEGILVGFGCGLVWDIFCHDILPSHGKLIVQPIPRSCTLNLFLRNQSATF